METLNSKKQKVIHDLTITIIRNQAKVDMLQSKVTDLFITIDSLQSIHGFKKFFFVYFLPPAISKYWCLFNYNMKLANDYMLDYQKLMRRNNKYAEWTDKLMEGVQNV